MLPSACVILLLTSFSTGLDFNYNLGDVYEGPYGWGKLNRHCEGQNQSPININTNLVEYHQYKPFTKSSGYVHTGNDKDGHLVNNGHAPTFMITRGAYHINGVPGNDEEFELFNVHIHFGPSVSNGSEHTINEIHYPAEIHLVNFNTKYDNFQTAQKHPDGLAVIAIFAEEVNYNYLLHYYNVDRYLQHVLPSIIQQEADVVAHIDPNMFLTFGPYYTYAGSLTTPNCYESVRWILMANPIFLSDQTMGLLRQLGTTHGLMCQPGNFRPTQPLNNRTIQGFGFF